MKGKPHGIRAGGWDPVFQVSRDDQIVPGLEGERPFLKLDGRGPLEEGHPFREILIIPEIRRTCVSEGGDVFGAKLKTLEERGDHFLISGTGGIME